MFGEEEHLQITKTVRIAGESERSIEAAIGSVLERADASLRDVQAYEVVRVGGRRDENGVWMHEVTCDVTFGVKEPAAYG